jgi:phosphoribosyl-AMP cyclohydrolase
VSTELHFDSAGLVPAVVQDAGTRDVLLVGFMSREALDQTRSTGLLHLWSRSRQALWLKGEQSGNFQRVEEIRVNCENNSLLILVRPDGPACHDGYASCFYRRLDADGTVEIITERIFDPASVYKETPE